MQVEKIIGSGPALKLFACLKNNQATKSFESNLSESKYERLKELK